MMDKISIIIPTYNERENIKELIPYIDSVLKENNITDYEIIIVDDNSPDGTADEAKKLSEKYPVKVIVRKNEKGLASAVIEGIKHASGNFCVVMDADFQHPPEVIPKLVNKLKEGYELVIASRYIEGGKIEKWNPVRKLISKTATILAYILFPQLKNIHDIMSGFFAFKTELVKRNLDKLNPLGYKILLEILIKCDIEKICEIPYTFKERKYGKSKLGIKNIVYYVIHLIKLSKYSKNYFPKFIIVGGIGTIVNFLVYNLILYLLGKASQLIITLAWLCGVEAGIINNFVLHEHWTFAPENLDKSKKSVTIRCLEFHLSNIGYIIITTATIYLLSILIGPKPILNWLGAITIGLIWNYFIARKIIWKGRK